MVSTWIAIQGMGDSYSRQDCWVRTPVKSTPVTIRVDFRGYTS